MKKEKICFQDGRVYAYEILTGKPKNFEEDLNKFFKAYSYAISNNGDSVFYHINLYPKTLLIYKNSILRLLSEKKNIVIELVEINSSINLNQLKEIIKEGNINISIDDFGCRSSNFDRLELPNIKTVKFDKSFWNNQITENTVKSIVSALKDRKILTVAEMVESEIEFNKAKEIGFDLFQGFYFSKEDKACAQRECYGNTNL
ncbi:EAL domain-containing protein [Persephonella sp.]